MIQLPDLSNTNIQMVSSCMSVMTKAAAEIRNLTLKQNFRRREEKQTSSVSLDSCLRILEMLSTVQYFVQNYGKIVIYGK